MITAKDIMTTQVVTVKPDTTVTELARIFIEHKISGAPVVNDRGELIGMITENDLIDKNKRFHIPTVVRLFDALIPLDPPSRIEHEIKRMAATTVSDMYSPAPLTITEETPLEDIATIMAEKKVHHIPVMQGSKVVGIIGKMDLIKGMGK